MKSQQGVWTVRIKTKLNENEWDLSMTTSEHSILAMLRLTYGTLEEQLKQMAKASPGSLPSDLVSEALALLRCLVFNRLEPINGSHIKVSPHRIG